MQRLIQPGGTRGGAGPKALLRIDAGACVIKFSELDDAVGTPLVGQHRRPERNHSLRLGLNGYYELTPAYDVVPTLLNMGRQSMLVGKAGSESSLDNALTALSEYGLKRSRAIALIQQVVRVVDGWQVHFLERGVTASDMELLRASIDRGALLHQRQAFA